MRTLIVSIALTAAFAAPALAKPSAHHDNVNNPCCLSIAHNGGGKGLGASSIHFSFSNHSAGFSFAFGAHADAGNPGNKFSIPMNVIRTSAWNPVGPMTVGHDIGGGREPSKPRHGGQDGGSGWNP